MTSSDSCPHLWLPVRGKVFRMIRCARCDEHRRVAPRWHQPTPLSIAEALEEAVRVGVMSAAENRWRQTG